MDIHINGTATELGGRYVVRGLRDSNDLLGNATALSERLHADGYVLIRGLLDRDEVLSARQSLLQPFAHTGDLDPTAALIDGVLRAEDPPINLAADWRDPKLRAVTSTGALPAFVSDVLGGEIVTYDYKWVRAIGPGGKTNLHWDAIFWEAGNVYSAWVPLGDIPAELGAIAFLTGAPDFVEEARRAPRVLKGSFDFWDTIDPFEIMDRTGGRLETTDFQAGDIALFTMYTPHTTLGNETNRVRMSVDVRFQLTSEPLDEQYMGENPPFFETARELIASRQQAPK